MKTLYKIFLIILSFACVTCDESPSKLEPITLTYEQSVLEDNLILLINNYRLQHNLQIVTSVKHMSALAYNHNLWMIENQQVNHSFFHDRADNIKEVLNINRVGEIIACNYVTNSSVLNAWINSSVHQAILDDYYEYAGVSITQDPITNRKYYTVIFGGT